ncbi:MAG: AAA family ATPase [Dehalococcoidia bacterium]|nr:AAA family ATPase [Dehalococcoidia bacterium]
MRQVVADDLDALLDVLPPHIREPLREQPGLSELLEVVIDLGSPPEARLPGSEVVVSCKEVDQNDISFVVSRIGEFTTDNRAGIERTLHRISAMRNRHGTIIGLTCRVGRAVYGMVDMIADLIESGQNILLLGRPGVGKTTMLREAARVLADKTRKRVVIIDTSNEIAGDGDIPHPAIGHARRMQVAAPERQHAVMIEAVENHMPQVIIIDEIGTELEAQAARTIAERGVQLIGTAHGNSLENLVLNPTLSDLIGGTQSVTLGDEEARRRGSQKSVLERKAPPTFDVVVEILDFYRVSVHTDVQESVDNLLTHRPVRTELRWVDSNDQVQKQVVLSPEVGEPQVAEATEEHQPQGREKPVRVYPFGVNRSRLEATAKRERLNIELVDILEGSDLFLTTRTHYRRKPQRIRDAEMMRIPVYVLRSNDMSQLRQCLHTISPGTSRANYVHQLQQLLEDGGNGNDGGERFREGASRGLR